MSVDMYLRISQDLKFGVEAFLKDEVSSSHQSLEREILDRDSAAAEAATGIELGKEHIISH